MNSTLAHLLSRAHKVLTYVEYRAVSDVFQNNDPPLSTQRVGGGHTRRAVRGWGGQYFGRR
jgi:hypothetical protein